MRNQCTHEVTTTDGVTICGTVHGHGPPLVFLQGGIGDGELDWQPLLGKLTDRYTCYLPSQRGRGLSGGHPDLSSRRLVDDVLAYVDSLGQPAGLVGWSTGADLALAVAARSASAVDAVAVYEPALLPLLDPQEQAALGDILVRMGELAAEGQLTDAMRTFASVPFNDDELAAAEDAGYLEAAGRYAPNLLDTIQQQAQYPGPTPDDPAILDAISNPVLVLQGSDTKPPMVRSARHVADHVPTATVQQIPGAGHAAPLTHPDTLADALIEFFSPAKHPA